MWIVLNFGIKIRQMEEFVGKMDQFCSGYRSRSLPPCV
jgi:hypothetical protein